MDGWRDNLVGRINSLNYLQPRQRNYNVPIFLTGGLNLPKGWQKEVAKSIFPILIVLT